MFLVNQVDMFIKRRIDLSTTFYQALVAVLVLTILPNVQALEKYKRFNLLNTNGSFTSPNYPMSYPKNIFYQWFLPTTSKKLRLEFINIDLYNCYVPKYYQECAYFDYITLSVQGYYTSYCNWNRPSGSFIIQPWSKVIVSFRSTDTFAYCRGKGFKVVYGTDHYRYLTTERPTRLPSTMPAIHTYRTGDGTGETSQLSKSSIMLIVAGSVSFFLLFLVIYCCCYQWHSASQRQTVRNQEVIRNDPTNEYLNRYGQPTRDTPVGEEPGRYSDMIRNSYQNNLILTVDLSMDNQHLPPRMGSSDGVALRERAPPLQNDPLCYSDQIENNYHDHPGDSEPPPSYEDVWNDGNTNSSYNLESPPSYENVMSGTTRQNTESLIQSTQRTDDTQRNYDNQGNPQR